MIEEIQVNEKLIPSSIPIKTGPSRIPTFGCRIPQPQFRSRYQQDQPSHAATPITPITCPITLKDIGRRVRVADREGILRFVGSVHFAPGVWCGVELDGAFGKHDGLVKGVRYFGCASNCGQMAPVSKVTLIEGDCDHNKDLETEDGASGPYSMLFIDNQIKETYVNNKANSNNCTYSLDAQNFYNKTTHDLECVNGKINRTYEIEEGEKSVVNNTINSETFNASRRHTFEFEKISGDSTFNVNDRTLQNNTINSETFSKSTGSSDTSGSCNETIVQKDDSKNATFPVKINNKNTAPLTEKCNTHNIADTQFPETEIRSRRSIFTFDRTSIFENNVAILGSDHLNKTNSLPQLRSLNRNFESLDFTSPPLSVVSLKFNHSTPVKPDSGTNNACLDDAGSKRDSLDLEESWGILTPDQMIDGMISMSVGSKTPSTEYIRSKLAEEISEKEKNCSSKQASTESLADKALDNKPQELDIKSELPSPSNITDYSLGIIDEHLLSNLTLKTDTTMNMELPLDTIDKSKDYNLARIEQTPSPEDLPLDPTPIIETDPKTEPTKSKTTNSFITSITSITSLDTGYQGDGEMSRPASRGADNSPLTRRPLPRPTPRRPDPMTDSDFYTESDADNQPEENVLRGDRRAQVIDGTLYGVDPQAAADIYANNRENMDSSGIFTDLETNNTHTDELPVPNQNMDVSPSDTSSKTISENSQDNLKEIISKTLNSNISVKNSDERIEPKKENGKKRNAPSPSSVGSSPSSMRSPRHVSKEETPVKKYKMPKKDVASKVKVLMEPVVMDVERKPSLKKPAGRWDAVLNKMAKTDVSKTNLKEVKSKVFSVTVSGAQRQNERKTITRTASSEKSQTPKTRRIRQRVVPTTKAHSNVGSSIHSSVSDLSGASTQPKKPGSAKKREAAQVTQVLTASKLSPRPPPQQISSEGKKPSSTSETKSSKRTLFSPKEKKQPPTIKECSRGTVKGGRNSPAVRPPAAPRTPAKNVPRVAEALAVLVQHLVFNVEAYQVPSLRRDVQKFRLEAEEIRLACQQLEETLADERVKQARAIEDERARCRKDISELIERHRAQIAQINEKNKEAEDNLLAEHESACQQLSKQHEEQLLTLKSEFQKLQKTHEESLDILREENDAIREQIDEKNEIIKQCKHESMKLKQDYEAKESRLVKENQRLKNELGNLEERFSEKMRALQDDNAKLREENDRLLSYGDDKGISMQEVQSLRAVLELKQNEVAELRRALAEATQKAESLAGAAEKVTALTARCEDLEHQLHRKTEYEQSLIMENKKLQESFKEEMNQKRRLTQYNEELQWKLKQNKEVICKVIEQAEESGFSRSNLSASFNERHNGTPKNFERTLSFRERTNSNRSNNSQDSLSRSKKSKLADFDFDDLSPPSSPKIKGIVEKSDSVSYVLDLDEDPNVVASRIFRRSFRNPTPPKNTPTKSPSLTNKRACMKNPLSLSASASSVIMSSKEPLRCRSASIRNGDDDMNNDVFIWTSTPSIKCDDNRLDESCESSCSSMKLDDHIDLDDENDVDIRLPALPSEIGRQHKVQALPSPKHFAGEAMISESNSEDESTSSSSVQL